MSNLVKFFKKTTKNIKDFWCYSIYSPLQDFRYSLKYFFRNIKVFRKTLWGFRPWDSQYVVDLSIVGFEQLRDCIKNGNEEQILRDKKVAKINELIELLKFDYEDIAFNEAHTANGFDDKMFQELTIKYKKEKFDKIYCILYGQDEQWLIDTFEAQKKELLKNNPQEYNEQEKSEFYKLYTDILDGSNIRCWWE